jgi:FkbH-like protein
MTEATMFEVDKYEARLHVDGPLRPAAAYDPTREIVKMSMLVWGEHCIECAAPSCFETCDLYQQRPDRRCRRFVYGIFRNDHFPSVRGFGAEVAFKRWGKLESRGNTFLMPARRVLRLERMIDALAPAGNAVGRAFYRLSRDIRWSYLTHTALERLLRRLHRRAADAPDAFLLEVYNPGPETVHLHLVMDAVSHKSADGAVRPAPSARFSTRVELPSGYVRYEFDRKLFSHVTESGSPFDIALIPEADANPRLVFVTADFVTFARRPSRGDAAAPPSVKCIVWDLDHTIWDGILLETEDVRPRAALVEMIRRLDERGILHSIASKNDHGHAWSKLEDLGLAQYFLYPKINWAPKPANLKRIATDLNIGLDTFAFVDDNEAELAQVREALPEVACFNVTEVHGFLEHPRFQGSSTVEARSRRQYYREAMVREEEQQRFAADYVGFLRSSRIELTVRQVVAADRERVDDLVQRTNQLNFSGRKYRREEIQPILDDHKLEKYVLDCRDRFGSYGIIGFAIVRRAGAQLEVQDFMLSCRVQGKLIEQAFFSHLHDTHPGAKAKRLWVNYTPTIRNAPARQVLDALGFAPPETGPGVVLDLARHELKCDFITIVGPDTLDRAHME